MSAVSFLNFPSPDCWIPGILPTYFNPFLDSSIFIEGWGPLWCRDRFSADRNATASVFRTKFWNPRNCTCFQCFLLFFILDALNCFVPAKLWNSYFRRSAWRVPFVLFRWSGNLWVARAERRASTFCIFLFWLHEKVVGSGFNLKCLVLVLLVARML